MRNFFRNKTVLTWAVFSVPVIWFGFIVESCCEKGISLFKWLENLNNAVQKPFSIKLTPYTPKVILIMLCVYGFVIAFYYSEKGNRRPGEEHGSAKWGNPNEINSHFNTSETDRYIIVSQNIKISMNVRNLPPEHQINQNVLVVGGSGSGKTRYYIKPNLLEADCSYIVCDPKGELYRSVGNVFKEKGYEISILNLVDMKNSDCYNPFKYIRTDSDAIRLVTNLIQNTTPKNASSNDPFWDKSETALISALMLYLIHEAVPEEQNFSTLMYMIENAAAREDDEGYKSPVDLIFDDLERVSPHHIALSQYKIFKQASGKTAKSILVSAAVRLAVFNLSEIAHITDTDNLSISTLSNKKRVIFAVIPDNDTSFNFIVGMLYTQIFQELYFMADNFYNGKLPVPVRFMMDEFPNVALPDNFEKILSTCRSREISINIVIQNMAQLKALFKDSWENIAGNCDTFIYLGGNEQSTHEYISKFIGKETIDTVTRGVTKGKSGSSSKNYQNAGRELMASNEVRMLSNRKSIIFIRGELPVIDFKYPLTKHKNYYLTSDNTRKPYKKNFSEIHLEKNDLDFDPNSEDIEIIEFKED